MSIRRNTLETQTLLLHLLSRISPNTWAKLRKVRKDLGRHGLGHGLKHYGSRKAHGIHVKKWVISSSTVLLLMRMLSSCKSWSLRRRRPCDCHKHQYTTLCCCVPQKFRRTQQSSHP